ncbi:MAG: dTMP kinase [Planctomycetota bacterium]|nr:dTMP kinase [Planctomycetota bacterium]
MDKLAKKLAGRFIVIDGPDGAGKSTQLTLLANWLRDQGVSIVETRDPGGTAVGDKIRKILLDTTNSKMTVGCEILLYMASRTQLMGEVIGPALQRNECVLCDRWVSATVAYQAAENKAKPAEIMEIYELALRGIRPDLTVILDVPAEAGLSRLTDAPDRMEAKGLGFHQKVRELFLKQAEAEPQAFAVVNASGSVEQVQDRLQDIIVNWKPDA